ncbi:hypothetical protein JOB18_049287 [Solea senegalensis]|uniref:Uncharacterized protein n=1 Tax=Solea senegalensis TaxID=28829 RepID=A0AAV6S9F6_SOLSE|nr:hypothetical protein JOB18_049287 [Solea senegalensis]
MHDNGFLAEVAAKLTEQQLNLTSSHGDGEGAFLSSAETLRPGQGRGRGLSLLTSHCQNEAVYSESPRPQS